MAALPLASGKNSPRNSSREKAHTREADAIAAARRRLPMVEVDAWTPVVGAHGEVPLIDVFEGRSQLFARYMMWYDGASAARQCEGCTMNIGHVMELGYLHSRDVTIAVLCQGPFDESNRYREFMQWEMPWYSVPSTSAGALIADRHFGMLVCYLRDDDRVFETYWTTGRGCELMGSSCAMLDTTVYGRQEAWEDSWRGLAATVLQHHVRSDAHRRRRPRRQPVWRAAHLTVVAAGRRSLRRPRHRRCHPGGPPPLSSSEPNFDERADDGCFRQKFPAGCRSAARHLTPPPGRGRRVQVPPDYTV
jgi:predicted dithiol-disulfide oxidoreductase (DUF899 family)